MMTPELLAALAVFAFVSSITPGPNNIMLMTSGINFGFGRTVPHMLGVAIGFTLMIVLIGLGIMQLIEAVPGSTLIITVASGLYLLYMAWKIATVDTAPAQSGTVASKPFTFLQAALFQWVNPKAWTMALTAISAYAPKSQGWLGVLLVAGVFGLINLPSTGSWALMGAKLRRFLEDPMRRRIFNIVAALLLVASLYPMVAALPE
ncbi:MAG TPA: LysE family translocator [Sphingorhabdus sp.]|jgi:threonine/homoserine/homoserine lactone efflux protein|nr:LysE family translocator [Sphingorhabdus sp.]